MGEAAILNGFGHVRRVQKIDAGEVGNGARQAQDAVPGTGGEMELLSGFLEQSARFWR